MGTRSRIAVRNDDGSFDSIYCHWDGYPSYVGVTLKNHYTTIDKVRALIALGDLSNLGAELGEKHAFDTRIKGACTAYGRDRGETNTGAVRSPDIAALKALTQDTGGEWLYVFDGRGWKCAEGGVSAFGLPATEKPGAMKSIDYWLQREAT